MCDELVPSVKEKSGDRRVWMWNEWHIEREESRRRDAGESLLKDNKSLVGLELDASTTWGCDHKERKGGAGKNQLGKDRGR